MRLQILSAVFGWSSSRELEECTLQVLRFAYRHSPALC